MVTLPTLFEALADETRLRVLGVILLREEACACDVEAILELSEASAAMHLDRLDAAGLLATRKHGLWRHYRLDPALDPARRRLLEALPALLGDATMADLRVRRDRWLAMKACQDDCCGSTAP